MTWDAHHRRSDVLHAVVDEANLRRDGSLPVDLPGVAETFRDELDLVATLQLRWHTRLAGRIERALMDQPTDLESAVLSGWRAAADELVGARRILDRYAEQPTDRRMADALGQARRKEWMLLAAMAGKAGAQDSLAVLVGRRLEEKARAGFVPAPATRPGRRPSQHSLLRRLRFRRAA